MTAICRRRLLAVAAGLLGVSAGCEDARSRSVPAPTASPFADVSVHGTQIEVTLRETAAIERVNLINPAGTAVATRTVATGQTRVNLPVGARYQPGTFTVTTNTGAEAALELRPSLEIVSLGVGANHMELMPDTMGNSEPHAATVVIRNAGSGPTAVTALAFQGDIPNPTEEVFRSKRASGIDAPEDPGATLDQVLIPPAESIRIFSSTLPFLFAGEEASCQTMPDDASVEVQIRDSVNSKVESESFRVEYRVDSANECEISITRRGS